MMSPVHNPASTLLVRPFAECATVLDINGDGKLDIAAGRNYYLAPDFKEIRRFPRWRGNERPDVDDNYEGTMDVNNTAARTFSVSGWMRREASVV